MKKLLLVTSVIAALTTTSANAAHNESMEGRPYAGVDLNFVETAHTNPSASDNDEMGFGLSLGYKIPRDRAYIAPEIFYDYIDSVIVHRLGAKVNVGYSFNDRFDGFVNLGVASVGYDDTTPSPQSSYSSSANKMAMIYGLGVTYDLNHDWAAKLAYDRQRFNIRYDNSSTDRISLNVFKIGVMYSF